MKSLLSRRIRAGKPARSRPFGVVVITILQIAGALAPLAVSALVSSRISPNLLDYLRRLQPNSFDLYETILSYFSALQASGWLLDLSPVDGLLAALILLVAVRLVIIAGFWYLKRWGWVLMMVQLGFVMLVDLYAYFSGGQHFLSMLNSILVVFYLNQRDVQQAFQARQQLLEPA
jgi:uncharacterized membrane protein